MATTTKKTVSADSSNPFATLVNLWPYMWPSDRPDLKMRVVWATVFLLISKIVLLLVPYFFKWATDALNGKADVVGLLPAFLTGAAMLVLAIGIHPWSVALAVIGAAIPSIGMASNGFHYFTDIIGGAFYATGMVCLAVLAAGPQALHHSQTRGASHWGSGSVRR